MGNTPAVAGLFVAGFIALKLMGAAFVVLLIMRIVAAVRGRSDRGPGDRRPALRGGHHRGPVSQDS